MIKFFRRIRQKLVSENKFSSYFLYAVGEILLVVVGILIALWINNWNEEKKEQQVERLLLQKLQEENNVNLQSLKEDVDYRQNLPGTIEDFYFFLLKNKTETKKDSLRSYLSDILRSTSYSFTQTNLINYTNSRENNFSTLSKELTTLQQLQNAIQTITEKGIEIKLNNFYQLLRNDIDFYSLNIHSFDVLNSLNFRNGVVLIQGIEEETSMIFDQTIRQMEKVDSLITQKIKK